MPTAKAFIEAVEWIQENTPPPRNMLDGEIYLNFEHGKIYVYWEGEEGACGHYENVREEYNMFTDHHELVKHVEERKQRERSQHVKRIAKKMLGG